MVQNHTCWWASCSVGLPKQRQVKVDWYELLCFGSSTVQLAHQDVWFCTMWPDRAKGLLPHILSGCRKNWLIVLNRNVVLFISEREYSTYVYHVNITLFIAWLSCITCHFFLQLEFYALNFSENMIISYIVKVVLMSFVKNIQFTKKEMLK